MYPIKIKEKYDQNNLANLWNRFTVPYLWTYIDWDFSEWNWSHPWVDIVPVSPNQEVLACLDGKVFKTWEDWAYGKFVFLEHLNVPHPDDLSRTTTLYSCHEHLSDIKVNIWDSVKEWDVIWKTWNTWNSFWEHLHFQIDKVEAPFHAYWPFTGAEAKAVGQSFSGWVNIWLGLDKAKLYTINPLVYLDKVSEYRKTNWISTPKLEKEVGNEDIRSVQEEIKVEKVVTTTPEVITVEQPKVENVSQSTTTTTTKIDMIKSDDNMIVSDPSIDFLSSLAWDDKKKTLKI